MSFKERVYEVVKGIKSGSTLSYSEVATRAGNPKACRAVGQILKQNYDPTIPCHRVIRKNGNLGGYNRGILSKIDILTKEKAI
jgi:O-6-methylguanine DNA methyltransferase